MWLLNTADYSLTSVLYPERYAILSHTWGDGEVTFDDIKNLDNASKKAGWDKIAQTCRLSAAQGFEYAWIDTCCIDKSSSAELSEAINSMFKWYKNATVCYAYLSDLDPDPTTIDLDDFDFFKHGIEKLEIEKLERDLPKCAWFARGWTLQELIAPRNIEFYDRGWTRRGTKASLGELLSAITTVPIWILLEKTPLDRCCVGRRMSWAAKRKTTRIEDLAYCLLGLFDVHMPMIYGEGENAFWRLQEAVATATNDMSLFAWSDPSLRSTVPFHGIFATSPAQFARCKGMVNSFSPSHYDLRAFSITNRGVKFRTYLRVNLDAGEYWLHLHCRETNKSHLASTLAICLAKTPTGFVRQRAGELLLDSVKPDRRDMFPGSILVRPVVPESAWPRLLTRFNFSFKFSISTASLKWSLRLSADNPRDLALRNAREIDPSYWDRSNHRFMTDAHPIFSGLLYLDFRRQDDEPTSVTPLLLFCGFYPPKMQPYAALFSDIEKSATDSMLATPTAKTWTPDDINVLDKHRVLSSRSTMYYPQFLSYAGDVIRDELKKMQETPSTHQTGDGISEGPPKLRRDQILPSRLENASSGLSVSIKLEEVREPYTVHHVTIILEDYDSKDPT
ncbi:heterokaryon incompatibility protein-domain-containing protein [Lasiosphaeria ovina]|uniref:Heterokaryon incompatibility protein-domain-containing protein n=1 Tax=Lasiosphaeria ovina TaxID=92902 RepID=A0AAE0NFJ7_9PEZI|nr:heterokaryon incompatibility protein-domain-containing protein [Lasiosphaeria ovina]